MSELLRRPSAHEVSNRVVQNCGVTGEIDEYSHRVPSQRLFNRILDFGITKVLDRYSDITCELHRPQFLVDGTADGQGVAYQFTVLHGVRWGRVHYEL